MTTPDIRPDLTGDVPRCSTECPHSEQRNDTTETTVRFCTAYGRHIEPGHICLPAVRDLVRLSRRRCDRCRNWTRSNEYPELGFCRVNPDEEGPSWCEDSFCSVWEAKP